MGMDGQGTTRIRRTKKKSYKGTGYGLFQSYGTNQNRNRLIKIRLPWHPITTMRRWEVETSGLPIKDYARRQTHLRYR